MEGQDQPEIAQAFELTIEVQESDIDQLGHVNNVTYLRWVQDVAVAHWNAAAREDDKSRLRWVVLRHEIDYKHPAVAGDMLILRTWVGEARRLRFDRHTEILRAGDHRCMAKARTVWCPIDASTGRPVEVSSRVRASFSNPGQNQRDCAG
jgi:acyl-CoA thioester hydrolase